MYLTSSFSKVKFHNPWHLDHHHGQDDYAIYATVGPEEIVVGKLTYSVYEDIPQISWIEVDPDYQRQGIGKRLIERLAQDYPYHEIKWGYTTESGDQLRRSIESYLQRRF